MSFNDKRALSIYEQSATRVGKHHAVALPFKKPLLCQRILSPLKSSFSCWPKIIKVPTAIECLC